MDDMCTHCMQKRLGQADVVDGVAAVMRAFLDASLDVQIYGCVNMYTQHAVESFIHSRGHAHLHAHAHTYPVKCMQMCGV